MEAPSLISFAGRLTLLKANDHGYLETRFDELVRGLEVLCQRLDAAQNGE